MSSSPHDTPAAPASRIVTCPGCKGNSVYAASNPYRPFCSMRCKNLDFGAWASESYRVESAPDPNDPLSEPGAASADDAEHRH